MNYELRKSILSFEKCKKISLQNVLSVLSIIDFYLLIQEFTKKKFCFDPMLY